MPDSRKPHQIVDDLSAAFAKLTDAEALAELASIPPLADEDDPSWDDAGYWNEVAYPYLALWNIVAERRLRAAIPLILDRACFGDPGEIMRNICHALEATVNPEWAALTGPCVEALESTRAGTRLWAAFELMRLRDPAAIPALERASRDEVPEVSERAAAALERSRG